MGRLRGGSKCIATRPRQGQINRQRYRKTHVGCNAEKRAIGRGGYEIFLRQQLDAVGGRLQPAETSARPRGAEAVLDPRGDFPFEPIARRRHQQDDRQQQAALHQSHQQVGQPRIHVWG